MHHFTAPCCVFRRYLRLPDNMHHAGGADSKAFVRACVERVLYTALSRTGRAAIARAVNKNTAQLTENTIKTAFMNSDVSERVHMALMLLIKSASGKFPTHFRGGTFPSPYLVQPRRKLRGLNVLCDHIEHQIPLSCHLRGSRRIGKRGALNLQVPAINGVG